jgi:hypothetical protein
VTAALPLATAGVDEASLSRIAPAIGAALGRR